MLRRRLHTCAAFMGFAVVPFLGCTEHGHFEGGSEAIGSTSQRLTGDGLVISQIYASTNSPKLNRAFIEIFNRSSDPISLDGLSLQTSLTSGNFGNRAVMPLPNAVVPAGGYFLVGSDPIYTKGTVVVDADFLVGPSWSTNSGKLALVRGVDQLACGALNNRCTDDRIIDIAGWNQDGASDVATDYEGAAAVSPAPEDTLSLARRNGGCVDTGNNLTDFTMMVAAPRNSSTAVRDCSVDPGTGTTGTAPTPGLGTGIVISEIYPWAQNSSTTWNQSVVELYNRSKTTQSLAGLSIQQQSNLLDFDATADLRVVALPDVNLPPGAHFLVGFNKSSLGAALTVPVDLQAPDTFLLGGTGKIALARGTAPLHCGGTGNRCTTNDVADIIGYSARAADYEGAIVRISSISALARKSAGCIDTDNNSLDFNSSPAVFRNLASPVDPCPSTAGTGMVLSQVYLGGGSASALYNQGFAELFNRSTAPVSLHGLSVQAASGTSSFTLVDKLPDVMVPPGGYYLVAFPTSGTVGAAFSSDLVGVKHSALTADAIALARVPSALAKDGLSIATNDVVDIVGINATTLEGNPTGALTSATAVIRKDDGCTDTNVNSADFEIGTPDPRNSSTPALPCGSGTGGNGVWDGTLDDPNAGTGIVISQLFTGGGTTPSAPNRDYVELLNITTQPVSLAGLTLQRADATGDFGVDRKADVIKLPSLVIQPESHLLIGLGSDDDTIGTAIAPNMVNTMNLADHGKILLARTRASLGCGGATRCSTTAAAAIVDLIGYGTDATDYEGAAAASALDAARAIGRKKTGCEDTNDNGADFEIVVPDPQNASRPAVDCTLPPIPTDPEVVADAGADASSDAGSDAATTDAGTDSGATVDASTPSEPTPAEVDASTPPSPSSDDDSGCTVSRAHERSTRSYLGGFALFALSLLAARRISSRQSRRLAS